MFPLRLPFNPLIPAKAGTQMGDSDVGSLNSELIQSATALETWVPAFAGMSGSIWGLEEHRSAHDHPRPSRRRVRLRAWQHRGPAEAELAAVEGAGDAQAQVVEGAAAGEGPV